MDDRKFDDLIKARVGEYHDPAFDPASLASLHLQVAANSSMPWYVNYRTEIFTASALVACTAVILLTQWYWKNQQVDMFRTEYAQQTEQIDGLKNDLHYWKSLPPDTVHVVEVREVNTDASQQFLWQMRMLEDQINLLSESRQAEAQQAPNETRTFNDIPFTTDYPITDRENYQGSSRRLPAESRAEGNQRALPDNTNQISNNVSQPLSTKTIRDIERHYQNGVGIKIGPLLEFSRGMYSHGVGRFDVGYGILADLILSPSLSLETGAKYFKRYYDLTDRSDLNSDNLPGVDESSGELEHAEIDYWMLEIPINLKYRYPISLKSRWVAGIGYSPQLYLKQIFEYDYAFDDGSGSSSFQIHSDNLEDKPTLYPGTLNFSIGVNKELKNKKFLETSIFYQHGLGTVGVEGIRTKFLGVRGVYWFTIR